MGEIENQNRSTNTYFLHSLIKNEKITSLRWIVTAGEIKLCVRGKKKDPKRQTIQNKNKSNANVAKYARRLNLSGLAI